MKNPKYRYEINQCALYKCQSKKKICSRTNMKLWELDWTEGKQYRNLCAGNSHTMYTVEKRNV